MAMKSPHLSATMRGPIVAAVQEYVRLVIIVSDPDVPLSTVLRQNRGAVSDIALAAGGAGGAAAGAAVWVASLGFWSSIGYSLGLVAMPLWAPVAGGLFGVTAAVVATRALFSRLSYTQKMELVTLGYHAAHLMAWADRKVTEPEEDYLNNFLLGTGLKKRDLEAIVEGVVDDVADLKIPKSLQGEKSAGQRESILVACWQLAMSDGVARQESVLLTKLRRQLEVETSASDIMKRAEEMTNVAADESEALVSVVRAIGGNVSGVNVRTVVEDLLAFNPRQEARERLARNAGRAMAAAKAASVLLGTHGEGSHLLRTVVKAYASLVASAGVGNQKVQRTLRNKAIHFGRELGLRSEDVVEQIGLVDTALSSEITTATQSLEKEKRKRSK